MPEISIIIPVYNVEKYLSTCLDSLLVQTFQDFEVILIDDGSPDKSGEICDEYAKKDKRIRVIHQSNQGAGISRNKGIEAANGTYIAFVDADDWTKPNMLEAAKSRLETGAYDLIMFGNEAIWYNDDETEIKRVEIWSPNDTVYSSDVECKEAFCDILFSTSFNTPWNKLYKMSIIKEHNIRFPQLRRAQDAIFNMEYYKYINSFCLIPDILYVFRMNNDEKVWKKFPKDLYLIDEYYDKFIVEMLEDWKQYTGKNKDRIDTLYVNSAYKTIGFFRNPLWGFSGSEKREYIAAIIDRPYLKNRLTTINFPNDRKMACKKTLLEEKNIDGIIRMIYTDNLICKFFESKVYKMLSFIKHKIIK
ncbi:MAG: glycosyltransferase [Clostridia bacterium]|nr:glycosyltransferase [Clostridia bacterium]